MQMAQAPSTQNSALLWQQQQLHQQQMQAQVSSLSTTAYTCMTHQAPPLQAGPSDPQHLTPPNSTQQRSQPPVKPHTSSTSLPQAFAKKLRRLEKNRESARECRRRKKEHVLDLQKQVTHLEAQNLKLKLQLKVGEEAIAQERSEKERITQKLDDMVKSGASESDIWQTIDMFKERYSDYGSDRRSAIEFHVNQLEKLLLPTKLTKLCVWMLLQMSPGPPSCSKPRPSTPPLKSPDCQQQSDIAQQLWQSISSELEVTAEQQKRLLSYRDTVCMLDGDLNVTLGMLGEMRGMIDDKNSSLDSELLEVQKILTPTQTAKFIVWVTQNPACMYLLNQLWTRVMMPEELPGNASLHGENSHPFPTMAGSSSRAEEAPPARDV